MIKKIRHCFQITLLFISIFIFIFTKTAQSKDNQLDQLSFCTTPIYLLKGDTVVSQGSGFIYGNILDQDNGFCTADIFLITNYHVLTGYPPEDSGKFLGDNVTFFIHENQNNPKCVRKINRPLFTKAKIPAWITSDKYPYADVAAIWLSPKIFHDISSPSIISSNYLDKNMQKQPTSKISIVGYPYNFFDSVNYLPIYKTGSIASDPAINFQDNPLFIVDASIYPGMSGSPVFLIGDGSWQDNNGNILSGYQRELLGIFSSGRIRKEFYQLQELYQNKPNSIKGVVIQESLELGYVWKPEILIDLTSNFNIEERRKKIPPFEIYYKETRLGCK